MKQLPMNFYQIPRTASTSMTTKDLKELLLETDGSVLACGVMWDIKSKPLGAGVHRVTLKERFDG